MPNKAFIKFASYFGILVGCFNILIGIGSDMRNLIFAVLGLICIIFSIGLLRSWKKIKLPMIIFSWLVIAFYILILLITALAFKSPKRIDPLVGVSLFFYFPLLLQSILYLKAAKSV